MKGEDRTEICTAHKYGTRAWRFLLLREVLRGKKGLPEDFFRRHNATTKGALAAHEREAEAIWRKYPTMKERAQALRQMRHVQPILPPILYLWHAFIAQLERAIVRRDDDWLQDFAKMTIHEGASSLGERAQFIAKVILLLEWQPQLTASEVRDGLKTEQLPDETLKVEGYVFENRDRVMDAIHDIADEIGFTFTTKACRGDPVQTIRRVGRK
jgi:hypothetical protein